MKMEVDMKKRFFNIEKKIHKNSILVLIYNVKTGKKYEGYVRNGYVYYLNIIPGTYEIGYWSLKGDMSNFNNYIDTKRVIFEIKPDTFTILDEYLVSVTYKEEINNWDNFHGKLDTQISTIVNKDKKDTIKKYFLEEVDKRNKWTDIVFE